MARSIGNFAGAQFTSAALTGFGGAGAFTMHAYIAPGSLGLCRLINLSGSLEWSIVAAQTFNQTARYGTVSLDEAYTSSSALNGGAMTMVFDGSQSTDATRLKLYVNGVSQTLVYGTTVPSTTSSGLDYLDLSGDETADQWVQDVALWNVALNDQEAMALFYVAPPLVRPQNLRHYWPMIKQSGGESDWVGQKTLAEVFTSQSQPSAWPYVRHAATSKRRFRSAAATGIPTLSAATAFNITGTTAQPRVTLTF